MKPEEMIPDKVQAWLRENGYGDVVDSRSVGGGCINNGIILATEAGDTFFLKTNQDAPEDMFAREAEGLEALRAVDGAPRAPRAYVSGSNFLLLEYVTPASRQKDYWPEFGRRLAALHAHTQEEFGFEHDNYIGSTPQPNPRTPDGYIFFARHRLGFQANLARQRGLLTREQASSIEELGGRLPELVPEQPASLIHGDLWGGNVIADSGGAPAIIDPAAHYGWAEAELAMTALFGAFPDSFYLAYVQENPLEPGYRERFPIYNLYHLLNHLNLFGRSYQGQILSILRRYQY